MTSLQRAMRKGALTTQREGEGHFGPRYRVLVGGRPTLIYVEKSSPPAYGKRQMWDVVDAQGDAYLFEAKGLSDAVAILRSLYTAFTVKEDA